MAVGRTAASLAGADEDYFADMDYGYRRASDPSVKLDVAEVRGRNNWNVWTAGNDRFWDRMANNSYGAFDLLKILSSYPQIGYCTEDSSGQHDNKYPERAAYKSGRPPPAAPVSADAEACKKDGKTWTPISRDVRWRYFGLVNEPCFEKAKGPDEYGLWLDKRVPASAECPADPFENETKYPGVKTGARGTTVPIGSYYGKASGIVGLRLFPNPAFDDAAKKKWDEAKRNGEATKYYTDPDYFNDKDLIRPYRVGMSCGFCHVGPNPSNPPADPENPKWANLNSNPGAQYFWIDRIFYWNPKDAQANFIFQLLHTSLPGSLDTSFVSTDNINNPRTMNAIYNVRARLEAAQEMARAACRRRARQQAVQRLPADQGTVRILRSGDQDRADAARPEGRLGFGRRARCAQSRVHQHRPVQRGMAAALQAARRRQADLADQDRRCRQELRLLAGELKPDAGPGAVLPQDRAAGSPQGCPGRRGPPDDGPGRARQGQGRVRGELRALPFEQAARQPVCCPASPARRDRSSRARRSISAGCAPRSPSRTSSTTTSCPPTVACRSPTSASTPAARSRPMRSAATSGTTSRPRPTRIFRRSARSPFTSPIAASLRPIPCPEADADMCGRRLSSACGPPHRSCRTTRSAPSTRTPRSRGG